MPILWSLWKKTFFHRNQSDALRENSSFQIYGKKHTGEPGHLVMPESKAAFKDH